jgi:hypothetical protein
LVHFQVSPCIFSFYFWLTLVFLLHLEFWPNSRQELKVKIESFDDFMDNFIMCNVNLDFSHPFKCEHVY